MTNANQISHRMSKKNQKLNGETSIPSYNCKVTSSLSQIGTGPWVLQGSCHVITKQRKPDKYYIFCI